ncbi:SMP-30/gluconolactonase/LRE family protein [Microbacterium resistens]|nr:SMP-30/gluconolactonase/LRE family protein [Microbacterium resistens]
MRTGNSGHDLTIATTESFQLGEGPLWDPIRERVFWVDIQAGRAINGALADDGSIVVLEVVQLDETVGAVAVSPAGDWLIAGHRRLVHRSADGALGDGPRILPEHSGSRLNDGKPDPAGRYLIGSLRLSGPSTTESLVAVDADGSMTTVDDDLTLSNGMVWSADGRTFYNIDTERQTIFCRDYDPVTGATGARKIFLTIDDGLPDGMTVDDEEHLWIAIWGLGEIRRYSPTAQLVQTIHVPAPHTSSVAFAGRALDTLVITTAREGLTDEQLATFPLSGRIFTTKPGVHGVQQPLWSGPARWT